MTTTDLLGAARDVPWLAAGILGLGAASWVVERIAGLTGPVTTLHRAWADRELRRLRREALLRAERRRLDTEEESAVMADLRAQVAELSLRLDALRRTVRAGEEHRRGMRDWADGLLRAARAAGITYTDPPRTDERPAVPAPAPTVEDRRNPTPAPALAG